MAPVLPRSRPEVPIRHERLAMLHQALRDEEETQAAEYAYHLSLPAADRVALGLTWAPIQVDPIDEDGLAPIVVIRAEDSLHEGIGPGDPVIIGPLNQPDIGLTGRVIHADALQAEVRLDRTEGEPQLATGPLGVTRAFDPSTYVRYRQALERLDRHDTPLRANLLSDEPTEAPDVGSLPEALEVLNPAQQRAAQLALCQPTLGCIHGPPGTGKTTTLVAILRALVAQGHKPWALADSNAAVDHLARSAHRAGLKVVRIGHASRIDPDNEAIARSAWIARSPYGATLKRIDRDLRRLWSKSGREAYEARKQLRKDRRDVMEQARQYVYAQADVIASTLGTLVLRGDELPPPHTAVVDEATQAVEPAVLMVANWAERLIIAGDPHQLGPVVMTKNSPLEVSLLERVIARGDAAPMLEVQHRMNTTLMDLVHDVYGDAYVAHPSVAGHTATERWPQLPDALTGPSLWIDTAGAGQEERDPLSQSLYNEVEIGLVRQVVTLLLEASIDPDDIGIIAPYSAQVARCKRALPELDIATVNAFQGREKPIIIASFVRANDVGELGFVEDERRLTVALTRAQRLFIGIGDTATLAAHPRYAALFERLAAHTVSVWEPPWLDSLAT